jgi:hypothetical protein
MQQRVTGFQFLDGAELKKSAPLRKVSNINIVTGAYVRCACRAHRGLPFSCAEDARWRWLGENSGKRLRG